VEGKGITRAFAFRYLGKPGMNPGQPVSGSRIEPRTFGILNAHATSSIDMYLNEHT
jgi:hypothetical protein